MNLPSIPKPIRYTVKAIDHLLRIILLFFMLYAIAFTLVASWGIWKVYEYGRSIYDEVAVLETVNPTQTEFMKSLQDSLPELSIKQSFIPLDSINPWLIKAVLASEDANFYQHPGFDVYAIAQAMQVNQKRKKQVFGGSTLTQQLAKNLFLSKERSWERKFKELGYALLLEKLLGKDRILELYLNYAQWGKDLFGCQVACLEYYKKPCSKITMNQSISLAAVLASPTKHHPHMAKSQFMAKRRLVIYQNMFPKDTLFTEVLDSIRSKIDSATAARQEKRNHIPTPAKKKASVIDL